MGGVVTRVSSGELTSVEQSLVERVGCGKLLDLVAEGEAVDATAMRSWGSPGPSGRACSATSCAGGWRLTLIRMGCGFGGPGSSVGLTWKTSPRMSASS